MSAYNYISEVKKLIDSVEETQMDNIKKAARVFADTIKSDNLIHVFGTGHSHLMGIELFDRAGSLAPINAMLDDTAVTSSGARKGTKMERLSGLAEIIWEQYDIKKDDIMMIVSNSGRNELPIEMAMLAKEKGLFLIALTSVEHSMKSASRHPGGKRLFEIADLVLDNKAPHGDCLLDFSGVKSGAASTVSGAVIVNSIVVETLKLLSDEGLKLPVFTGQPVEGYDNDQLYAKYTKRIKYL